MRNKLPWDTRQSRDTWQVCVCGVTSVNLGFRSELLQLGFFYTNADNLSCRQKRYPTATKRTELCSHNIQWSKHTSSILPGWLAGEVWCIKPQSFTFIYVCPSGFQSPLLLIYFLMVYTNIISHAAVFVSRQKRLCMTLRIGVAKTAPMCDDPLSRWAWPGAASLRYRNCAEITVLICEQKPYPVGFSWRNKSSPVIRYSGIEHISLSSR